MEMEGALWNKYKKNQLEETNNYYCILDNFLERFLLKLKFKSVIFQNSFQF